MLNLMQRPELLSTLLATMLDGLSVVDTDGVHIYVNDALCEMLGFSREELLGVGAPYPYWPSDQLVHIEAAFERTLGDDSANFELVFARKDGTRVEVIVAPAALRDEQGTVLAHFATVKDISERKRLERSLLASERRWRSVAENPFDFVVLIDRDYRYTYINHALPGITAESLIGRATPLDMVDAEHHEVMLAAFKTTFETGRATSYEVHVPQLGAWYASVVGAITEEGRVTGLSVLTRDISEQKRAERALAESQQRLREAHKMETVGTLAGGIAHDINNMLTPVLAYTGLAQVDLPPEHRVQSYLEGIRVASLRARELVQRVLLFSRRKEPHKATFDLRQSVAEDLILLRASLPPNIEMVATLPDSPVYVSADRAQLGQVLTNLATNALQAMQDDGGKLTITLEQAPGGAAEPSARLSVCDSGPGMSEETLRRVFEPFFTTKPPGDGTGLGLSIVDSVVREHGGETLVETTPGQGAVFTVSLPTTSASPGLSASAIQAAQPTSPLRVLVIDDESAIADVACEALTRAGHRVTASTSPVSAMEIFKRDVDDFDVVLTDQSMPEMSGVALIAEIRALRPTLPCLLMTGRDDEATRLRARSLHVREVIAKPFSLSTLLDAVARAGSIPAAIEE